MTTNDAGTTTITGRWVSRVRRVTTTVRDEAGVETHVVCNETFHEDREVWVPYERTLTRTVVENGVPVTYEAKERFEEAEAPDA